MKPLNTFFAVTLVTLSAVSHAQVKYSRVKIYLSSDGLSSLVSQGVGFDHGEFNREDKTYTTTLNERELLKLKKSGTKYSILIDDEVANFVKTNNRDDFYKYADGTMSGGKLLFETPCESNLTNIQVPVGFIPGSYGGYYTFNEMQSRIDSMVHRYPTLVQKIILPTVTLQGRPLVVVKISDNVTTDENEPEAYYSGLHHAREGMSMMNLFFFMQYLVEHYNSDSRIKDLLDNRELFFLPCVNPDGYVYNQTSAPSGGGMWRKNRRNNGGGDWGVDLNRNYNVDWGVNGPNVSISTDPADDDYIGPGAFSELETQAIRAFAETRHFTIAIDHHAYGNYYVTPYGRPANHSLTGEDVAFYTNASALMARYNGYFAGDGMATVNYYAVGNSRDWHITGDIGTGTKQKTYGYTVEIGPGNLGFWPTAANIIPIAKSMFFSNMQMAYMAGPYYELQDMNSMGVNSYSGNFKFNIHRIGLTDGPVTISILPLYNIQSVGSAVTINSIDRYYDSVQRSISYTLPGYLTPGSKIKFAYQISSGGITWTDTMTKIFQPIVILADNMESAISNNWNVTGSWGASTIDGYQSARSLSESPVGNYTSNNNSSATYKFNINLSDASYAYLSFWVRHNAQNSYDKLQIQFSNTGSGAGANFQPVCGRNTINENIGTLGNKPALTGIREAWTREIIDLKSYRGNGNVGLRFAFTSNASTVDDGFYIDDVELIKSTDVTLATTFINVNAFRSGTSVQVTWDASVDANLDYFEVQRSDNGENFTGIGKVKGNPPYQFIDLSPADNNYYRVRAVDKQGNSVFSKIVNTRENSAYPVSIHPNPAANSLYISLKLLEQTNFMITLTDMTGRTIYEELFQAVKGVSSKGLNISKLPPQVYFLRLRNLKTRVETINKIIKN